MNDDNEELGSLSQSSRLASLKTARTTMYVVGVLTLVVNLGFVVFAKNLVDAQVEKEIGPLRAQGMQFDHQKLEELKAQAVFQTRAVNGAFAAIGAIFLVMGAMIEAAPVPITVTALILYIGCWGISVMLDPDKENGIEKVLLKGLLIKVIIIAALFKGIQAAIAYQREAAME